MKTLGDISEWVRSTTTVVMSSLLPGICVSHLLARMHQCDACQIRIHAHHDHTHGLAMLMCKHAIHGYRAAWHLRAQTSTISLQDASGLVFMATPTASSFSITCAGNDARKAIHGERAAAPDCAANGRARRDCKAAYKSISAHPTRHQLRAPKTCRCEARVDATPQLVGQHQST